MTCPTTLARHPTVMVHSNAGVRQACVAAPVLWNLYIHDFFLLLEKKFSSEWLLEHLTVFADDFHVFFEFNSEELLQQSLVELRRFLDALSEFGLRINIDKTAFLLHLRGRRAPKWRSKLVRGNASSRKVRLEATSKDEEPMHIPLAREHKYLGII